MMNSTDSDAPCIQVNGGEGVTRENAVKTLIPLSAKKSFWETFKAMEDSPLKEQIQDVFLLYNLKKKEIKPSKSSSLFAFCFTLIQNGPSEMLRYSREFRSAKEKREKRGPSLGMEFKTLSLKNISFVTISDVRTTLGKLIYLMGLDMEKINLLLAEKEQDESIKLIDTLFEEELNKIQNALNAFQESHKKSGVQDDQRALTARIPIELAKALIGDSGALNIGIIEPLMNKFLQEKRNLPFEKNIAFILNSLKTSSILRQRLHLISAPFSQVSPSSDLIRITLGLKPNAYITALDAKKTALAALLSHLRQSPASSCFASYLAIEILSRHPINCLHDFTELLLSSHLSRELHGEKKEFLFLMRTGKESVSKKIQIDAAGNIYEGQNCMCHLSDVPGIIAAAKSIGIKEKRHVLSQIAADLGLVEKEKIFTVSFSKLLKKLSAKVPGNFLYNFNIAKLSFESQLHNPLLRIFENTIAAMAEGSEHSKIKEMLIHAFIETLMPLCGNEQDFKQILAKKIRYNLMEAAYYAYDTDVKNHYLVADGKSERGAFILYHKTTSSNIKDWKLIETASDFVTFGLSVIRKSFSGIPDKESLLAEIRKFITKEEFIIRSLQLYHPDNLHLGEKIGEEEIKLLSHTPWRDKTGNNSSEVLKIYFNNPLLAPLAVINPKSSEKLLTALLELARKFPDSLKNELMKNPHILSPLIIKDVHACSFMFGHQTFMRAIKSKAPIATWIEENFLYFGRSVADTKLEKEERQKVMVFVSHHAGLHREKEMLHKFEKEANSIAPECTLTFFRNSLIQIIKDLHPISCLPLKSIITGLDFFIYKHILKEDTQKKLLDSTVHFADTNWNAGLHDLHLCFIFNPASKSLEVWEVQENNEGLNPLSQDDWVKKQTWQIYSP